MVFVLLLIGTVGFGVFAAKYRRIHKSRRLNLDFRKFDLSNVKLSDGRLPDKFSIETQILSIAKTEFWRAGIFVQKGKSRPVVIYTNQKFPKEESTPEGTKVVGINSWGITSLFTGRVHLGNFKIDEMNKKFSSNDELAKALAYLTMHEGGHALGITESFDTINESEVMGDLFTALHTPGAVFGPKMFDNYVQWLLKDKALSQTVIDEMMAVKD